MEKTVLFIRANPVKPDSRVEKEVEALVNHGYDVSVLAWDRDEDYPIRKETLNESLNMVKAYRVGIKSQYGSGMKNLKNLARFQFAIRSFLKKNTFDIIHACDFDTAFTAFHSINHKRSKFVYDIFDYYADAFSIPSFLRGTVINCDRKLINKSDLTIICTEQRREQIKGATPKKLIVIHNSPPAVELDTCAERCDATIRIAYFGILAEGRLIRELVDAVSNDEKFELHIGGFGPLESYVKGVSEKNKNVVFYGKVPYKKVLELEQRCDILTAIYDPEVKNHYYAAPNKFYEALMLGKPVIMVKNTGMSEVVDDNKIGVTIEYSRNGLFKGLEEMISMLEDKQGIASHMKKLYHDKYSWEEMSSRLIAAYNAL